MEQGNKNASLMGGGSHAPGLMERGRKYPCAGLSLSCGTQREGADDLGSCEAGAGRGRMTVGTEAHRSDSSLHSEGREDPMLCLLTEICTKKSPMPPARVKLHSLSLCRKKSVEM